MDLDKAIKERHSVRNYKKDKKIDYRAIMDIIGAGNKAPLAGNTPCLKYLVVFDKKKIKELAESAQQDFIADVDWVIVICSDKTMMTRSYYDRAERYARHQAGAIIENMLLKITDLGLASCWIGAFADNIVKRILSIPENIEVEAMIPIGYELGKGKQKVKPDLDNMVFFNVWKNKFLEGRKQMTPGFKT
jgi:nitroreductase